MRSFSGRAYLMKTSLMRPTAQLGRQNWNYPLKNLLLGGAREINCSVSASKWPSKFNEKSHRETIEMMRAIEKKWPEECGAPRNNFFTLSKWQTQLERRHLSQIRLRRGQKAKGGGLPSRVYIVVILSLSPSLSLFPLPVQVDNANKTAATNHEQPILVLSSV